MIAVRRFSTRMIIGCEMSIFFVFLGCRKFDVSAQRWFGEGCVRREFGDLFSIADFSGQNLVK